MRLVSVNVGLPVEAEHQGKKFQTGIYKSSVAGPVAVHRLGIAGDGQADHSVHGGVDMAVYAYPVSHYTSWSHELGRDDLVPGQFGENLTVEGFDEADVRIGDTLRIGGALLQVSEPRIPCYKLVMRMNAGSNFAARFLKSGRLGFYLRVLEEGEIAANDSIVPVAQAADSPTMAEFIRVSQFEQNNLKGLRRVQAAEGLSEKWVRALQSHIDRLTIGG